ncbi:hypothetical protein IQ235_00935 [Oscillatoriales cyanobacterium LEGE 11467]|uniref:Uncharacterized protein n=1 Tax=Zarconia navalis LEGE 11467 TaxID=1828826 RepID=A0A928VX96_9CYAN|nr:hypothetical protein [Zarconia navalis]MBE9039360.1 hypothetical protein [Zarconia navalis LEGE 11467]
MDNLLTPIVLRTRYAIEPPEVSGNLLVPVEPPEVSGNLSKAIEAPAISENLVGKYRDTLSPPASLNEEVKA